MTNITIAWLILPFLIGFTIYLIPKLDRILAIGMAVASGVYAIQLFLASSSLNLKLLDSFGVSLLIDELSSFFILTNAFVTAAVIIYCWQTGKKAFFYMQIAMLHGSVNATFICADFISLYVALEVISIAAFLLITYPRTDRSIWVGLRYLFISNVAMLFYLVGAVLVYKGNNSFGYQGLLNSPPEAIALIFLGLLAKGGIFISGLWLPLTHSESQSQVSAMLSGIVVKAGVFPLVRCALILGEVDPIVRFFGVASAILGVSYAIWEQDTKRTLAFSTVSQLGFVIAAPTVGGFYALTHGLAKSALFLTAGILPSRDFSELQKQRIDPKVWLVLAIGSLSIAGFPLLSGFEAKIITTKNLLPWQTLIMNITAVGTAITYAKFIFLAPNPFAKNGQEMVKGKEKKKIQSGFWWAVTLLIAGLIGANVLYYEAYTIQNVIKQLIIISIGGTIHLLVSRKLILKLPRVAEKFDHLIGVMSLMLILVFWMVRI